MVCTFNHTTGSRSPPGGMFDVPVHTEGHFLVVNCTDDLRHDKLHRPAHSQVVVFDELQGSHMQRIGLESVSTQPSLAAWPNAVSNIAEELVIYLQHFRMWVLLGLEQLAYMCAFVGTKIKQDARAPSKEVIMALLVKGSGGDIKPPALEFKRKVVVFLARGRGTLQVSKASEGQQHKRRQVHSPNPRSSARDAHRPFLSV
mmetsp:Transcript_121048/g.302070  ORF Transcript_121048/g.302070 Transcript_121048/m.302070 type:complete len:201 (-) Transcript_121048:328-930(-)